MNDGHRPNSDGHRPNSVPPRWSKLILRLFFGLCAALAAGGFFWRPHGKHHALEEYMLFYPLYGFLGIAGLIMASKGLRRLVMRREDYYDDE